MEKIRAQKRKNKFFNLKKKKTQQNIFKQQNP